jgi:hypothetical protein
MLLALEIAGGIVLILLIGKGVPWFVHKVMDRIEEEAYLEVPSAETKPDHEKPEQEDRGVANIQ